MLEIVTILVSILMTGLVYWQTTLVKKSIKSNEKNIDATVLFQVYTTMSETRELRKKLYEIEDSVVKDYKKWDDDQKKLAIELTPQLSHIAYLVESGLINKEIVAGAYKNVFSKCYNKLGSFIEFERSDFEDNNRYSHLQSFVTTINL